MADHERKLELHGYATEGSYVLVDMRQLTGRWLAGVTDLGASDMEGLCTHLSAVLAGGDLPGGTSTDALFDLPAPDLLEIIKGVSGLARVPKSGPQ